jgi:predicted Zn-dependent protease
MVEANLIALQQTRTELTVYRWPDIALQDVLRQNDQGETAQLAKRYRAVLDSDPNNVTALWRLGQIDLAQENYSDACRYLSAAYAAAPQHRAVRQLFGECQALFGAPAEAATLWHSIDVGQGQLLIRQWWYSEYLHDGARARILQTAIEATAAFRP